MHWPVVPSENTIDDGNAYEKTKEEEQFDATRIMLLHILASEYKFLKSFMCPKVEFSGLKISDLESEKEWEMFPFDCGMSKCGKCSIAVKSEELQLDLFFEPALDKKVVVNVWKEMERKGEKTLRGS
jgi:hypothetical protein